MKTRENKAMRFASVLLVLTLLATSLTAGTFAKYATEKSGEATARVAKFGVDVAVDTANLFGQNYNNVTNGNNVNSDFNTGTISVKADELVVAPGTTGSMTFSATGKPETDVKLTITVANQEGKRVRLAVGSYKNGEESVEVQDSDYYPIKWTLKGADGNPISECTKVDLQTINTYFNNNFGKYSAGTDLSSTVKYTLSWEWAYDDTVSGTNDGADTILGYLAANAIDNDITKKNESNNYVAIEEKDYDLNEEIDFSISVEQAD